MLSFSFVDCATVVIGLEGVRNARIALLVGELTVQDHTIVM